MLYTDQAGNEVSKDKVTVLAQPVEYEDSDLKFSNYQDFEGFRSYAEQHYMDMFNNLKAGHVVTKDEARQLSFLCSDLKCILDMRCLNGN